MPRRNRASNRASWPWSSFLRSWQRDGGAAGLDDAARAGVRRGSDGGVRQHPAAEGEGQGCREAEEHPAAGGRDPHHVERPAGDRDRAGQPAGRLRSAIQPADRLHPAPVHGGRSKTKRHRCGGRGGPDRVHRGHRDWRGHRQRLLLRSLRLVWRRRLHVQRRVGRLVRRTAKMRARIGRITGRTWSRNAATGARTWPTSGAIVRRRRSSSAPSGSRRGRRIARSHRRSASSAEPRRSLRRRPGRAGPARKPAATAGTPLKRPGSGAARARTHSPGTRAGSPNARPVRAARRSRSSSRGGGGRRR